jgi:hypothetical protein
MRRPGNVTNVGTELGRRYRITTADPPRTWFGWFGICWERAASLGPRRSDTGAMEEYDRRGRITGSGPDVALDQARASYLTDRDLLIIAGAREICRELSRPVSDDLV